MAIHLPTEIVDTIISFVDDADLIRHPYLNENTWRCRATTESYRTSLATLHLVSKFYHQSASIPFFRHFNATVTQYPYTKSLENLLHLSNSEHATSVRHLEVGFRHFCQPDHGPLFESFKYLAGILPACLMRFPNLEALNFNFQMPRCPREIAEVFRDMIIAALSYLSLPKLTELDLTFPITYNIGLLLGSKSTKLRIPIENVLRRLRHLSVCLSEYTGTRDQGYWRRPDSAENAALPNNTHAMNLCKVFELAENLQSLAIESKDIINIDNMNLHKSIRLKLLSLECVSISAQTFLSLIEQCEDTITSIELYRVGLTSGTWQQVFVRMSRLPNLFNIWTHFGGYSRNGTSSNLRPSCTNSGEDIESVDVFDTFALGNVQRRVNKNRLAAGCPQFSDGQYRHAQLIPLEDARAMGHEEAMTIYLLAKPLSYLTY